MFLSYCSTLGGEKFAARKKHGVVRKIRFRAQTFLSLLSTQADTPDIGTKWEKEAQSLGFEEERGRKELARKPTCTSSALGSAAASEHGERGGR